MVSTLTPMPQNDRTQNDRPPYPDRWFCDRCVLGIPPTTHPQHIHDPPGAAPLFPWGLHGIQGDLKKIVECYKLQRIMKQ